VEKARQTSNFFPTFTHIRHKYLSSLLGYFQKPPNTTPSAASTTNSQTESQSSPQPTISPASAYTPFPETKHTIFRVTMPRLTIHAIYDSAHVLTRKTCTESDDDELISRASIMEGLVGGRCSTLLTTCYPCINESGTTDYFMWTSRDYPKISFDAMETCAPELHFDELDDQISSILKGFPDIPRVGNHFVTRHSNLDHVHLIYHLVTQEATSTTTVGSTMDEFAPSGNTSTPTTPTSTSDHYDEIIKGWDQVVASIDECGAREVSIILPLAMTVRHPRVKQFRKLKLPVYSGDELLFQLEDILNRLKTMKNPLENIFLFLPANPKHSSGHFSKQLEILIRNTFENPNDKDDFCQVLILSNTASTINL
jgi:hypothetical protein